MRQAGFQQPFDQSERQGWLLQLHDGRSARESYQDLLEKLFGIKTSVRLQRLDQGMKLAERMVIHNYYFLLSVHFAHWRAGHGDNILRVAQVVSIDFGQRRERADQKLIVLLWVTQQGISHHDLMLGILDLIKDVVIEDKRADKHRVVKLDHFENRDQARHLIERDIDLS